MGGCLQAGLEDIVDGNPPVKMPKIAATIMPLGK